MSRKPTHRRSYKDEDMELNLTPMMNLIGILIPVLLMSTAFVELVVIDVATPAIGEEAPSTPPLDRPPLNLTVLITHTAYILSGSAPLDIKSGQTHANIPIVQKTVGCGSYMETVPPPRQKNRE